MIEIFDNKKSLHQKEASLADMFKSKKKELKKPQDDQLPAQVIKDQDNHPARKNEKTKEELAELRKAMMKSKVKRNQDNVAAAGNIKAREAEDLKPKKDPKQDLMVRLAMGQKVQVDKKEMKKLTSKNYANLPEIKAKKEEEKKRQENMARKAAAAEYMKQLNDKRKNMLKKKKSILPEDQ